MAGVRVALVVGGLRGQRGEAQVHAVRGDHLRIKRAEEEEENEEADEEEGGGSKLQRGCP